jgi:hypothetical protein
VEVGCVADVSKEHTPTIISPDDGSSMFLLNTSNKAHFYMAQAPIRRINIKKERSVSISRYCP